MVLETLFYDPHLLRHPVHFIMNTLLIQRITRINAAVAFSEAHGLSQLHVLAAVVP